MARYRNSDVSYKNYITLCNPVCKKTPFYRTKSKFAGEIFDKTFYSDGQRNCVPLKSRCNRKLLCQNRVPIALVSNSETKREGAAGIQFAPLKSVLKPPKISSDQSISRTKVSPRERLCGKNRYFSSILSRPGERKPSTLTGLCIPGNSVPNDLTSLWPIKRTSRFFSDQQLVSKSLKSSRLSGTSISRRFSLSSSKPLSAGGSDERKRVSHGKFRMDVKSRKIRRKSDKRIRISRYCMEYCDKSEVSSAIKDQPLVEGVKLVVNPSLVDLEVRNFADRVSRVRFSCDATRQAIDKTPAKGKPKTSR